MQSDAEASITLSDASDALHLTATDFILVLLR
jgi:hypothetical protein